MTCKGIERPERRDMGFCGNVNEDQVLDIVRSKEIQIGCGNVIVSDKAFEARYCKFGEGII